LHLMPIVDVRTDPFDNVAMMQHLRDISVRVLDDKGYTAVPVVLSKDSPAVTSGELARMSDAELAARAPQEARYIVVVYLEDVKTDVDELGETTRVRLGGRLIDVAAAHLLWRDFAYGESDLGGLLTVLSGPATSYEAAYDSVRALFATLPDGSHARKR